METSSAQQAGPTTSARIPFGAMLGSMAVVAALNGVQQGYLTPLLPSLGHSLHMTASGQSQVYLLSRLATAVWMPLLAKLGDSYGHRRFLRVAIAMVAIGSLLMSVWPSTATLSVGVVFQGAAVGFMPLLIGILRYRAPGRRRFGVGLLVGTLLGALGVGGLVAGTLSEHSATLGLWVAVPVAALAVVASFVIPPGGPGSGERFALVPFVLLALGLVGVVSALALGAGWGWLSAGTIGLALGGVAALVAWIFVERRTASPLIDLRILANPAVAVVATITFCLSFCTIGFLAANSIFLGAKPGRSGFGLGYGPQVIALISLARAFFSIGASLCVAPLMRKIGERRTVVLPGVLIALGFGSFLLWHETFVEYFIATALLGLAMGCYEASGRALIVESVPEKDTAVAAGVNELALALGATVGAAIIGAIITAHESGTGATLTGFDLVWSVCLGMALVGAGLGFCYRRSAGALGRLA
ncbi:MFS transporter [Amycolatopsis acidicola]|uniref:MFS transporter n=1 Tax=Amycolatopsis acidicola TaxID=2596893 RepID=A0A5N0V8H5_9PSEU|nr:MFS transporter [Amycolatopsis acidicola]KAA9162667.1 MFS transporter [Amycolatopsis acidicola]